MFQSFQANQEETLHINTNIVDLPSSGSITIPSTFDKHFVVSECAC